MKSAKKPPGLCPSTGCYNRGDPFCHEHLKPHAEWLLAEIKKQELEIDKAKQGLWRSIDVQGTYAREFLRVVRERRGRPTLAGINRGIFRDPVVAETYMRALARAGLIKIGKDGRGHDVVFLPEKMKA